MKQAKLCIIGFLFVLIIPSIAYASWWNPFVSKVQTIAPIQVNESHLKVSEKKVQTRPSVQRKKQKYSKSSTDHPTKRKSIGTFSPGVSSWGNMDTKNWNAPTGGEILYAQNLPSSKETKLFNSVPAVDGTYENISPLGQTSSSR